MLKRSGAWLHAQGKWRLVVHTADEGEDDPRAELMCAQQQRHMVGAVPPAVCVAARACTWNSHCSADPSVQSDDEEAWNGRRS